jgi:hypothetical protein
MALQISEVGTTATKAIVDELGVPEKPRKFVTFAEEAIEKLFQIVDSYGLVQAEESGEHKGSGAEEASEGGEELEDVPDIELPEAVDFTSAVVDPPTAPGKKGAGSRGGKGGSAKKDYSRTEQNSRKIGLAGEKFALMYEQWRLMENEELAGEIDHVASYDDRRGYDIRSFDLDGTERYVEVKTTTGQGSEPFYISAGEIKALRQDPEKYVILRVFDIRENPRCYEIRGKDVDDKFHFEPINWIVSLKN